MCDGLVSLPGIGSLTSLQILYIWGCHNLTSLPQEISNLTSLKLLTIEECPLLGQRCKRQIGEDWPIIAHVPIVDVDEWNQQEETISSESDLESESVCLLPEDELILQQPLQNLDYITVWRFMYVYKLTISGAGQNCIILRLPQQILVILEVVFQVFLRLLRVPQYFNQWAFWWRSLYR
ncbi:uncharacterized protein LOC126723451 isoform X2 [Quercus robur]|uniref:uncharacterized protein LOC126723451 isoform X2 n=1 Tax=Quercus robur TaxID=38942 RepID=UPI0021631692|nr:uncharacterized protein LOC126723451 isoform X2 [Quercus robur]